MKHAVMTNQKLSHSGDRSVRRAAVMSGEDDRGDVPGRGTAVITKTKPKTKKPSLYRVLLLNDDYTPMEFVIRVLQQFFQHDLETATLIMLKIHHEGRGVCGVYTRDVAATKVELVLAAARRDQHPLQCIMESA